MPAAVLGPVLASIIGVGGGVASSLLNKSKTSTYSSAPQWTPDQQGVQTSLGGLLQQRMQSPDAGIGPMKTAAVEDLNRTYRDAPGAISQKLAARGYGSSGKMGNTLYRMESDRLGKLSDLNGQFAGLQLNQENQIVDEAQRYGFASPGNAGQSTTPGNMLGGGISSGLETFTSLFALNRLLQGQNGGGGGYSAPSLYSGDYTGTNSDYGYGEGIGLP